MKLHFFAFAGAVAAACASPRDPAQTSSAVPVPAADARLPVVPMDSATIYRLCAKPDRVLAGWAECVLKDQSPPLRAIPRPPP